MRPTENTYPRPDSLLPVLLDGPVVDKPKKKKKKKGKKKDKKPASRIGTSRGIETMFRTSYMTHVNLSALADSKANIMISINGIIMSIIIASISPKIDSNPWLLIPTSVLLISCMISITYAVLAARPRLSKKGKDQPLAMQGRAALTRNGPPKPPEAMKRKASILFFGHFTTMKEADFVDSMIDLLGNLDDLYESMVRDIYNLGQVLARKFNLLRVSYTVFMIGLAAGVLLYIIAFAGVALSPVPAPATTTP